MAARNGRRHTAGRLRPSHRRDPQLPLPLADVIQPPHPAPLIWSTPSGRRIYTDWRGQAWEVLRDPQRGDDAVGVPLDYETPQ